MTENNFETKKIKEEMFETCFVMESNILAAENSRLTLKCCLCIKTEKYLRAIYKHIQANHPDDGSETMKTCSEHCIAGRMIQTKIVDHLLSFFVAVEMSSAAELCEECIKPSTNQDNDFTTCLCPGGMKLQRVLYSHLQSEHLAELTLYNECGIAMTNCFCVEGLQIQKDLVNHLLAHLVGINDTDWIKKEETNEESPSRVLKRASSENLSNQNAFDKLKAIVGDDDEDTSLSTMQHSVSFADVNNFNSLDYENQSFKSKRSRRRTSAKTHPSDEHYFLENRHYFCKLCSYVTVHKKRYRSHWEGTHDLSNPTPHHRVLKRSKDHQGDGDFKLEQKRYYCRLCPYVCDSKQRHRVHWDAEHNLINAHVCSEPFCDNRFQTIAEVEKHRQRRHENLSIESKETPEIARNVNNENSNLKCEICSKEFPSATKLRLHRVIHRDKAFGCDICGFQAYSRAYLKIHMGRKHLTNFVCGQCNESFSMKSKLNEHEKSIHSGSTITFRFHSNENDQYVCDQPDCGRSFADKNKLKQHHENVHSKVLCDQCSMLVVLRHLERHMQSRHGYEKPFKCEFPDCKSTGFIYRRSLMLHMNLHEGIKPFQCEYCSKAYVSKNSLAIHLIQHVNPNKYRCELCQTNFTTGQGLRSHIRLHSTEPLARPHSCSHPGCNKTFKFPEHVKAHFYHCHTEAGREKIRLLASRPNKKKYPKKKKGTRQRTVHKEYKKILDETVNKVRYLCEFEGCGRHFSDKRVLESHINKHLGIKSSFPCGICSQSFATQKSLKIHQPIHLDYDSFSCKFCGKGYKSKSSLIYHEGTHGNHTSRKPRKLK